MRVNSYRFNSYRISNRTVSTRTVSTRTEKPAPLQLVPKNSYRFNSYRFNSYRISSNYVKSKIYRLNHTSDTSVKTANPQKKTHCTRLASSRYITSQTPIGAKTIIQINEYRSLYRLNLTPNEGVRGKMGEKAGHI